MSIRCLFYFKIDGVDPFVLLPSLDPADISLSIWHFSRVPVGIHREWETLALQWLRSQRPGYAERVATIEDGYFFSYAPPPSRRVFYRVRPHRRLALGKVAQIPPGFDGYLDLVLVGDTTNVKEYYIDVPGGAPPLSATSARIETVSWEVLPPGWCRDPQYREKFISEYSGGYMSKVDASRLEFFDSLGPQIWRVGWALGSRPYWIAMFETIAFAECPIEGNAIYWCPASECESILQLTKQEALSAGAGRIFHKTFWKDHVIDLLRDAGEVVG